MADDARTDLPSPSAPNFEQRVREALMTYLGRQGNALDRGITVRDLWEIGLVRFKPGSKELEIGDGVPVGPGGGGTGTGGGTDPPYEVDLTPPPTPTGFKLAAGIDIVFVTVDPPLYPQGHGHLRTHVYGKAMGVGDPLPTFGDPDVVELGTFEGTIWAISSPPQTTWRMWVKWESRDNVLSVDPAGGANGLEVTTGYDVELLLWLLTGQITESQLYSSLGSRINLIDGNGTGSVNARVAAEQTARETEDGKLYAQYTVKVDLAGHVSGFGLASEGSTTETPRSAFGIRADRFWLAPPAINQPTAPNTNNYVGKVWNDTSVTPAITKYWSGTAWVTSPTAKLPFVVQVTPTTINGQSVPAGVYIDSAYIANGTITNAMIGLATITTANIGDVSAVKITTGSLQVGTEIYSASFSDVLNTGWKIKGDGSAIFNQVTVRGTVYATNGSFTGTVWATDGSFKGTLLGGSATDYTTGTGLFSGLVSTAYRWRVGTPGAARIQWTGSAIEIYNGSGQLTLSSGGVDYSNVTGTKPPANATSNTIYRQGTQPSGVNGDIWVNTGVNPVVTYVFTGGSWQLASNLTTDTNQLTDGAGLGNKAIWAQVTGAGKPADGATSNLILNGTANPDNALGANGDVYFQWGLPTGNAVWVKTNGTWYLSGNTGATFDGNALWGTNIKGNLNPSNVDTYISGAIIKTAFIADAAITRAKVLDGEIVSAKIENGAITSAKIGSAAVETLKIAGNAVTLAQSGNASSNDSARVVITVPSDAVGQPIVIWGYHDAIYATNTTAGSNPYLRFYCAGTYNGELARVDLQQNRWSDDFGTTFETTQAGFLMTVVTPGSAGSYTVYLSWISSAGEQYWGTDSGRIASLMCKR